MKQQALSANFRRLPPLSSLSSPPLVDLRRPLAGSLALPQPYADRLHPPGRSCRPCFTMGSPDLTAPPHLHARKIRTRIGSSHTNGNTNNAPLSKEGLIVLIVLSSVSILAFIAMLVWRCRRKAKRKKKRKKRGSSGSGGSSGSESGSSSEGSESS